MNKPNHSTALLPLVLALGSSLTLLTPGTLTAQSSAQGPGSTRGPANDPWSFVLPEQRSTQVRRPEELFTAPIPYMPKPPTISDPRFDATPRYLSLSDVLNISLNNLEVVRVLGGVNATSTGRTVYDVAITNTRIDQQRGTFDPTLRVNNTWNQNENPIGFVNPGDPTQAFIGGTTNSGHNLDFGLSKRTVTGGVLDFGVNSNDGRTRPGVFPLNPQVRSSTDLSYTQPLLRGAGLAVNTIPIVLARIDTERSFFQYKASVQSHVQSVISGYWALVFARTELWAREQQVAQLEFANDRTQARLEVGDADRGEAAQTRVAYESFRASLLASQANVLQREAALRNVMGLPPYESERLTPVSPLIDEELSVQWENLLTLAERQRPDIIELKLVLEADQQRLLQSRNQALPQLNGVALYRWNGLEGEMPNGNNLQSGAGQFSDWNLGVNFSVPLGLRTDRAILRQQELIIRRDQANLQQGLHQAVHNLALSVRNLDQFYQQYRRFQAVRAAAQINLDQQMEKSNEGLIQFIIVLQAIVDWGNAVSSEASSLVQYNTELAQLELESGTILETHGIAFFEERFGSIGPLGRYAEDQCYPATTMPTQNVARYGSSGEASEEFFELDDPLTAKSESEPIDSQFDSAGDASELPMPDAGGARSDSSRGDSSPSDAPNSPDSASKKASAPVRMARAIRDFFQ